MDLEKRLNLQADKIDATLSEFGVKGRVCGGAVLPQVVLFQLHLGPAQRLADVQRLREELAIRLDVSGVIVSRQDGAVRIEVPRPERKILTMAELLPRMADAVPAQTALLGLSESGLPLLIYFPSPDVAHLLVAGITGSGKTELLRSIVVSLSLWSGREAAVYIVDPKNARLSELAQLPSVMQICSGDMAPALLTRLLEEMQRRGGSRGRKEIYLVIDELADLVLVDRAVEVALTRLVQRGREVGMHVIAATQRPSASAVAGLMKANFPVRISGAVNSRSEAAIATGIPGSEAQKLLGKGDMVLVHQSRIERFQACYVPVLGESAAQALLEAPVGKSVSVPNNIVDITARLRDRLRLRGPGRPAEGPTEAMVQFAIGQILAHGECTQRALRNWHKAEHGSDIHPPRVVAAIEEAQRRILELAQKGQGG